MIFNDERNATIGAAYNPTPVFVDDLILPATLLALTEVIAENTHDIWSEARLKQGWTYGPQHDGVLKKHPDLLPYPLLPEEEKEYDRATAMNAIKLVLKLGYSIQKK